MIQFIKDVSQHKLTILHDAPEYKHLRFSNNGSNVYRFDLVIFPGSLLITGDMGDYLFQRSNDMIRWFLDGLKDDEFKINPAYWSQKVVAEGREKVQEFSFDLLVKSIREDATSWFNEEDISPDLKPRFDEEVESFISDLRHTLYCNDYNWCIRELDGAYITGEWGTYTFIDPYGDGLPNALEFTPNFNWCCCAIVWGLRKYEHGIQ